MSALDIEEQFVEPLSTESSKFCVKNFIWSEEEWPKIKYNNYSDAEEVPVISFKGILDDKKDQDYNKVCKAMVDASEKWGFFKLVNHGVALETIEELKACLNKLFDLSMEQKLRGGRSSTLPLGYSATNPDYGTNLPWVEILQLLQSTPQVIAFATKVFGDQHQSFSDAMIEYMNALDKLGMRILEMLAHGLGLPDEFFVRNFEEKEATMIRINRYPPCPLPEKCLGLGSHSDPHTLTILLQDDVGGLQVLKNDNQWVGISPIPNSFVINIGDTLEAWSNGRLNSVLHRAVVNKEKQRLSAAYFMSPTSSAIIECPSQLIDPKNNPRKYVAFTWEHFRKELLAEKRVVGKTALLRYLCN
ncbi:putative Gibberellin 20 oxidase [Quillaja saponaria]|uniref:Gibberellin 20 oxidase n=1 Tax=Quillaja saponaria TaxID=32244 RepID=A0AAD7L6N0_QUISA|nr:putative Gibberellin 20 oxidase [Quillaja saponaria]